MTDKKWDKIATKEEISKTIESLGKNGINAILVKNKEEAKNKVLEMIPEGAEVFTMTSITLQESGIADAINKSNKYDSIRNKFNEMSKDSTKKRDMRKLGAAPDWAIGSAHAVTEEGEVVIASNTGSQLPAYVYGGENVIWIVGTQKIVKNLDEAFKRIYEHTLELESARARKVYGADGSFVSKLLIIKREIRQGRITIIFINEKIGF